MFYKKIPIKACCLQISFIIQCIMCYLGEVVAEWLASRTRNPKVVGSNLRSSRDCRWGEWMYSALFTLNTTTEVPLSKAPNLQLLPGAAA